MSYTHVQREIVVAQAALSSAAAVVGRYTVGYFPCLLRAVALVWTTVPSASTMVMLIRNRPTAGSATAQTTAGTINSTTTNSAAGRVLYLDDLNSRVNPGGEFAFEVTATAAAGIFDLKIVIEESWENPVNNTRMTETL